MSVYANVFVLLPLEYLVTCRLWGGLVFMESEAESTTVTTVDYFFVLRQFFFCLLLHCAKEEKNIVQNSWRIEIYSACIPVQSFLQSCELIAWYGVLCSHSLSSEGGF